MDSILAWILSVSLAITVRFLGGGGEAPLVFLSSHMAQHCSMLEPSHVVSPNCCPAGVLPILHEFLKVGQYLGLDPLCFSGHYSQVAIHKAHGIQLIINGWLA